MRRQYGVDVRIARIFNTYGPGMAADDGRVISNFVIQALRGDRSPSTATATQTRSFCYVDDMVAGLLRLMGGPALGAEPINLGNPHEVTVAHLADAVRAWPARARPRPCIRCPSMIPSSAAPISAAPAPASTGSPRSG